MSTKKNTYSLGDLNNPAKLKEVASYLAEFIRENNLYQKIERTNRRTGEVIVKYYANVESWLFAGSLLNLRAISGEPVDLSDGSEIKYRTTVEVMDFSFSPAVVVSRGTAISSNKEGFFRSAPEFSICSMSQTRAIGKAYRILIGHLLKVAGFESTPSEEMTEIKGSNNKQSSRSREDIISLVTFTLDGCSSTKEIERLGKSIGDLSSDPEIRPLLGARYKELQAEELEAAKLQKEAEEETRDRSPEEVSNEHEHTNN